MLFRSEALGVAEADRKKFIRLDDAKGKLAPPTGAQWFQREGVTMPYGLGGEQVGVLVPHAFDAPGGELTTRKAIEVLQLIDERWTAKLPYSASPQSDRYVLPIMMQHLRFGRKAAKALLYDWIANGMVRTELTDPHAKMRGLRVLKWPG